MRGEDTPTPGWGSALPSPAVEEETGEAPTAATTQSWTNVSTSPAECQHGIYIVWWKHRYLQYVEMVAGDKWTVDRGHTGTGTRIVLVEVTMSTMGPAARWWCRWYFSICIVCPLLTRRCLGLGMSEYLTNIRKWRPGDQPLHGPAGHDVTMSRGSVATPHPRHAAFIARLLFSC